MEASVLEKVVTNVTVYNILNALVVLFLAYVTATVVTFLVSRIGERMGLHRIPVKMAVPVLKIVIYAVAAYYILISSLSLTATQFVAVAGLIGAGIGFGLKDVFASLVGGLIIATERPYNVGDMVTLRGYYGEVTDIGLRSTRLITPTGDTITSPNDVLISDPVASSNAGDVEMLVVIDLFIDPAADFDLAMKILKEAVITSKYVYLSEDRPLFIFLNDYPFYRRVRAKAFVYDLRHEFDFRSEVTVRAWREFLRNGIEPPRADLVNIGGKPWPAPYGERSSPGDTGGKNGPHGDDMGR